MSDHPVRVDKTSPASVVPAEVLGKIFHLLCDKPIDVGPYIFGTNTDFPWALGCVCRQWRCGFISYPPIWTSISFYDFSVGADGIESARRIALYLERSRELPLDISVSVGSDDGVPALRLLLACSYRWRTARISIRDEGLMDELFACKGKMSILESLEVRAPYLRGDEDGHIDANHHIHLGDYDAFEIAPKVHTIKLDCGDGIIRWALPWSQLTKLHVTMSTLFDVPALLQELVSIEELLFEFSGIEFQITRNLGLFDGFSVRLEHLRILQVPFPMILAWIEAPLLEELRLGDPDNWFYPRKPYRRQLLSLIHRSGPSCQIRRLVLRGDDIKTVENIISTLRDVEELYICTPENDATFDFDHLPSKYVYRIVSKLADLHNHVYLPTLRRIAIAFDPEGTLSTMVQTMSRLLESRGVRRSTLAVAPLESVVIQMATSSSESDARLPTELVEAIRKWPPFVEIGFKSKY